MCFEIKQKHWKWQIGQSRANAVVHYSFGSEPIGKCSIFLVIVCDAGDGDGKWVSWKKCWISDLFGCAVTPIGMCNICVRSNQFSLTSCFPSTWTKQDQHSTSKLLHVPHCFTLLNNNYRYLMKLKSKPLTLYAVSQFRFFLIQKTFYSMHLRLPWTSCITRYFNQNSIVVLVIATAREYQFLFFLSLSHVMNNPHLPRLHFGLSLCLDIAAHVATAKYVCV